MNNIDDFINQYNEIMFCEKTEPTWLQTYYKHIKDGKIIVGQELMLQLEKLIADLDNPRYKYEVREAWSRILFMETCCLQSKAPFYNKPLKLLLWQKCFFECLYSFKMADTGLDRFKNAILVVARKAGKSSMFAADAMFDLFVGSGGQDICVCSIDDKTAKLIFEEIKKMASKLDRKEKLVHKTIVNIENTQTDTFVFKLSAKSKNLDGFNCSKAIQDELHQDPTDDMYMAVLQSMSVRENPKYVGVSTNGFLDDGYLERKLKYCRAVLNDEYEDETQLSFLYTQDSENEIYQNPLSWYKANPSLGIVKKWDFLKERVNAAKFEKATKIHVLCKDFNIKQNSAEAFLMASDYSYEQVVTDLEEFRDKYCFGAVDLAMTTDMSCAKIMFMKPNDNRKYIFTKYFIPQSKLENADDKAAGAKYAEWARDGLLDIHEGNEVDLSKIADWFKDLYMNYGIRLFKLGYDNRFSKDFLSTMDSYGYGNKKGEVCEMINQSKYVMSTPIKLLEADLKSQIVQGINDMDKWCFSNAAIQVDDSQLVMLVKTNQHKRIDGIVTASILYAIFSRYRSDYMKYVNGEA